MRQGSQILRKQILNGRILCSGALWLHAGALLISSDKKEAAHGSERPKSREETPKKGCNIERLLAMLHCAI